MAKKPAPPAKPAKEPVAVKEAAKPASLKSKVTNESAIAAAKALKVAPEQPAPKASKLILPPSVGGPALLYANALNKIDKGLGLLTGSGHGITPMSTGVLCYDYINSGGVPAGMSICAGAEMGGKCVRGDTMVNTSDGFFSLDTLISKKGLTKAKRLKVQTERGFKTVSHLYKSKRKEKTIKLETANGTVIEGTYDHPMLVLDSKLEFKWKRLDTIMAGDFLTVSPNKAPHFGTAPTSMAMASIMGYLTANGMANSFSTGYPDVLDRFNSAVKAVTGAVSRRTDLKGDAKVSAPSYRVGRVNGVPFRDHLATFGYTSKRSSDKEIPTSILTAPKEVLHEYLESYFECDSGGSRGGEVTIISASERLITQLRHILYSVYGIRGIQRSALAAATGKKTKSPPVYRPYYRLILEGRTALTFIDTFKRCKCQWAREYIRTGNVFGSNFRRVPYVKNAILNAYAKAHIKGTNPQNFTVMTLDGLRKHNFRKPYCIKPENTGQNSKHPHSTEYAFSRTDWSFFIPHIAQIDPALSKKLKMLVNSDFTFEEVKEVSRPEKRIRVYDLTVPETHSFVANNVVSHNSTLVIKAYGSAYQQGVPLSLYVDAEGSMIPEYAAQVIGRGIGPDVLFADPNRSRYYQTEILEDVANQIRLFCKVMPQKRWLVEEETWSYFLPKGTKTTAAWLKAASDINLKPSTKIKDEAHWVVPTEHAGPEAFIAVDSWLALVSEGVEEDGATNQMGRNASPLAKNLPTFASKLKSRGICLLSTNQIKENPSARFGSPFYEAGGNALKTHSVQRTQFFSRAVPQGLDRDPDAGSLCIEKSVEGKGNDLYAYKALQNSKNKMGRPFMKTMIRVWTSDHKGQARGIDPVHDALNYLQMTAQIDGSYKKGLRLDLRDSIKGKVVDKLNNRLMSYETFKGLVLAVDTNNLKLAEQVRATLKIDSLPDLRAALFKQLRNDKGLWSITASAVGDDVEDDGDDE
jgi:RecA/RadA recombinase